MVDSLERLEEDDVIDEFVYSENMFVVEDAAAALRDYAEAGHDLVIAHGSQYGGSLQEIAPDFPRPPSLGGQRQTRSDSTTFRAIPRPPIRGPT